MQPAKSEGNKTGESTANWVIVAVICLAIGLAVGYYFGKNLGSNPVGTVASSPADVQEQPPAAMDPAVFIASEKNFQSILQANPRDLNTLIQLGNLYFDNSQFNQAVDAYARALDIDPNNANVRTDRGSCFWSLGQPDAAIGEFEKSLKLNPTHAQTLYNMGIVYLHGKNNMAEARKYWEKLLATNPDYPQRARLQEMLASMNSMPASGMGSDPASAAPAQPPSDSAGQPKPGTSKMGDLFEKMKK
jgi:cytochrome c-type biogenesis protein CcmH/NrfG